MADIVTRMAPSRKFWALLQAGGVTSPAVRCPTPGHGRRGWMQAPWRDRRGRFLWLKALVLPALFVPGLLYAYWLGTDQLGGRPVMETIHGTGLWALRLLLISSAITPLARA